MELTDRKKQILKVVTERYIETAEPVSSKFIAQAMGGSVSPATIRNELADLVEMGYLTNPVDAELLSNDPRSFARGIYNGMLMYFQLV